MCKIIINMDRLQVTFLLFSTELFLSILLNVSCLEVREENKRVVVESLPLWRMKAAYMVPTYIENMYDRMFIMVKTKKIKKEFKCWT